MLAGRQQVQLHQQLPAGAQQAPCCSHIQSAYRTMATDIVQGRDTFTATVNGAVEPTPLLSGMGKQRQGPISPSQNRSRSCICL